MKPIQIFQIIIAQLLIVLVMVPAADFWYNNFYDYWMILVYTLISSVATIIGIIIYNFFRKKTNNGIQDTY